MSSAARNARDINTRNASAGRALGGGWQEPDALAVSTWRNSGRGM